jgi:uncharacterized protein YcfL
MKKMVLIFATMLAIVGCGENTSSEVTTDSLSIDSTVIVVDSTLVGDSTKIDTLTKDSLTK